MRAVSDDNHHSIRMLMRILPAKATAGPSGNVLEQRSEARLHRVHGSESMRILALFRELEIFLTLLSGGNQRSRSSAGVLFIISVKLGRPQLEFKIQKGPPISIGPCKLRWMLSAAAGAS